MDARSVYIALQEVEGIGWLSMTRLIGHIDEWADMLRQDAEYWNQFDFLYKSVKARLIQSFHEMYVESVIRKYENAGIRTITVWDSEYPPLLNEIHDRPWVLYAKGDVSLLQLPSIAIVGTRTPTIYGKKGAYDIARELGRYQAAVTSGLARGIDSEAHRGALDAGGATIAVVGCGVDVVYPQENRELYDRIAKNGLLLSEFPMGTAAKPGLFPLRNRIISGISLGTLVVEAARKSGSLITSDYATKQNRDVFAVPGSIFSPKNEGSNDLLRQGARIVLQAEDILKDYPFIQLREAERSRTQFGVSSLLPDERDVLRFITYEPVTLDRLLEQTETTFGKLHTILLTLLMKNKIEQLPGPAYMLK